MSELLERLKVGLAKAQQKQAEVLKQFQAVQAEYQAATQEVVGYQKVLENETRIEQQNSTLSEMAKDAVKMTDGIEREAHPPEQINKTQIIRDALGQRHGMNPTDVWNAVRGQIKGRTYVYSVLKRLKDRKQVIERRGKYYLPATAKAEGENEHMTTPIQ